jgi:hypothetical protein
MLTIKEAIGQLDEDIDQADPKRPDYCTCVELERLRNWRELLLQITDVIARMQLAADSPPFSSLEPQEQKVLRAARKLREKGGWRMREGGA